MVTEVTRADAPGNVGVRGQVRAQTADERRFQRRVRLRKSRRLQPRALLRQEQGKGP